MDYKKKYNEALEKARKLIKNDPDHILYEHDIKKIFSELNDNEDEMIIKAIQIYLDWLDGRNKDYLPKGEYSIRNMIDWLDGQKIKLRKDCDNDFEILKDFKPYFRPAKEQEIPVKAVGKFNVGDWLVFEGYRVNKSDVVQIISDDGEFRYQLETMEGIVFHLNQDKVNKDYRLWKIEDARPGDVLFVNNPDNMGGCVFIYRGIDKLDNSRFVANGYCCLDINANCEFDFCTFGPDCIELDKIMPATKADSDILFKKMKECGYKWDPVSLKLSKMNTVIETEEIVCNGTLSPFVQYNVGSCDNLKVGDKVKLTITKK